MSTLTKQAIFITFLIVIPMMSTNILLNNLHIAELGLEWRTVIEVGAALAIIIFCLLWVRNKNKHIEVK